MSQPRVNIYGFPHKGLKNALSQLLYTASRADSANPESIDELKTLSDEVTLLLELHQDAEDQVVLPALEARVAGSTTHNASEHDRLHALVEGIKQQTSQLEAGQSPMATATLFDAIGGFYSDYLKHMAEEENEINQVIWNAFSDEEILGWQPQIMEKLNPEQKMLWFRFIVPALNPFERQIMLGGVRESVPGEVYAGIIESLKPYMTEAELAPLAA